MALNFQLESAKNAPGLARDALTQFEDELDHERLTDLRLVVSELVTNSVQFGPGTPISVAVSVEDDGGVGGFVDDGGEGGISMTEGDPINATGLGLQIVAALSTDWGVDPGTSRVWFQLAHA